MYIRVAGLALPFVIGIGLAITSCSAPGTVKPAASDTPSPSGAAVSGSPTASPSAPSSAAAVPAGYTRAGGAAQGISVATPASWVAVDLAKETIDSASKKIGLKGFSASTLTQDMESLLKLHAVFVVDVTGAVNGQSFAPNLNAYCVTSGVTDVGAAGAPLLKEEAAAEFQKIGAAHVTQKDLEIGGVPGVETSYQLSSSSVGTLYGSQLEVLPKPDKACFVTLTVANSQSAGNTLSVAAATAQFP
ncbi:MAG: hypothetical protein JWM19_4866 [Actinomycetia bacterium]|nr:hypothetical protein [Actinomycetes bacterium]